jgi:hypothetical protein
MYFTLATIEENFAGTGHTVQVVEVRNGQAHLVTLHSEPFDHWWIPIAALTAEYSAFHYLGRAEALRWIELFSWVSNIQLPNPLAWRIDHYNGHLAHLNPAPMNEIDDLGVPSEFLEVNVLALVSNFRPSTDSEIAESLGSVGRGDLIWTSVPPEFDDEYPVSTAPRTSSYERLMLEED